MTLDPGRAESDSTKVVRPGSASAESWLGFVRTERGITALVSSRVHEPAGAVTLVQLDESGQPISDPPVHLRLGTGYLTCVIPIGLNRALMLWTPAGAPLGPLGPQELYLLTLGSTPTFAVLPGLTLAGNPRMSYAPLSDGRVGVLGDSGNDLVWSVVGDDGSVFSEHLSRPADRAVNHAALWMDGDDNPWILYVDDFRQVQAVRYKSGVPGEVQSLTRRFGQRQEVSEPEPLLGSEGRFVVYCGNRTIVNAQIAAS